MLKIFAILFLALAAAMIWQHARYLNARRNNMMDRQPMLYPSAAFHVATFLDVAEGDDPIEQLSKLRQATEAPGRADWVYAGLGGAALQSKQLGPIECDAAILVQYASRAVYDEVAKSQAFAQALSPFAGSYSIGLERPWHLNLAIHQFMLGLRFVDILHGGWTVEPLVPDTEGRISDASGGQDGPSRLREMRAINDRAVVVFNLMKEGTAEQRAADQAYGLKMIRRMASLAHGPMHVGRAVTVERDASFDNIVLMYYPGPDYMADMLESTFFRSIAGDKQPGDTLAVPTVPILDRL